MNDEERTPVRRALVSVHDKSGLAELAAVENIVAVKQADPDIEHTRRLRELCDLQVYAGNDDMLLDVLELGSDVLPVYVGDDETDEDAFRAVRDRGLGVVVRGEGDDRPTLARYTLRDTVEARAFVELLIDALSERAPS